MNRKWFALSIDQIEEKLDTNAASGLSIKEARSRKGKETPFFKVKRKSIGALTVDLFSEFFLLLLALISFFALFFPGERFLGIAVIIIVIVNIVLTLLIHFIGTRSVESMSKLFLPTVRVIRGGKLYVLDYCDVVIGDVIMLEKGDVIGVDARLVYSDGLKVNMQVDKKTEKTLVKYANKTPNSAEIYAENMENMVHAGSTVLEGSGRAVVVAVGEYTYLGSMTGGFVQDADNSLPEPVKTLQKKFSKFSLVLLIAVFPFCVISLLLAHFIPGGTTTLPITVMSVVGFCAVFRLSSFSVLFVHFFNRYLRKAAVSGNPCIFRSAYALDKVAETDYIFLLDGSIATDGILHFEGLETVDGVIKDLDGVAGSAKELFNMATIYAQARTSLPTIGVKSFDMIDIAISELLSKSKFDKEALKIRCAINSYFPSAEQNLSDVISYVELGEKKEMRVSGSSLIIDSCDCALISGEVTPISEEGISNIKKLFYNNVNSGKRPIVFVSVSENRKCFVGMLILREGLDYTSVHAVNEFRRNGIGVIAFSNCYDRGRNVPEIPDLLKSNKVASFFDFKSRDIPVTFDFGNYDEYNGFGEDDIYQLAKLVKSQGKTLTVVGFSEYAEKAIELADVFVSCVPIKTRRSGYFSEEVTAREVPGEESSASCIQTVKTNADVLLMRPKNGKGGLEPLMRSMEYCRMAYRNLNRFLVYLFSAQIIRFIVIMFPLLYGHVFADARHLCMAGLIFDIFALILFMTNSSRASNSVQNIKKLYVDRKLSDVLKKYRTIIICAVFGGALIVLLPTVFDYFDFLGGYNHTEAYAFISLMLVQFVLFASIYLVDLRNKGAVLHLLKRKTFLLELCVFAAFLTLCFLFDPIGDVFALSGDFVVRSPFYFLLTLVPAFAFAVVYTVVRKSGKGDRGNGKNIKKLKRKDK